MGRQVTVPADVHPYERLVGRRESQNIRVTVTIDVDQIESRPARPPLPRPQFRHRPEAARAKQICGTFDYGQAGRRRGASPVQIPEDGERRAPIGLP